MSNIFFVSDTHFYHKNLLNFKREDGSSLRPFKTIEEMHNVLFSNWNSVVSKQDKVYHLGDVALQVKTGLGFLKDLNGTKVLIKGNHDSLNVNEYSKYFKDVRGSDLRGEWKFVLSHIPIHGDSIKEGWTNVHGHLHYKKILDRRYFNVSVECINYTPIELTELRRQIESSY